MAKSSLRTSIKATGFEQSARETRSDVKSALSVLLEALEKEIGTIIRGNFSTKSFGGVGNDDIRWRKLAPSTIARKGHDKIGVDTGEMRAKFNVSTEGLVITATYGNVAHAKHFDAKRPLLPDVVPESWENRLIMAGQRAIDDFFAP